MQVMLAVLILIVYLQYRKRGDNVRDFFEDSEKVEPKDDKSAESEEVTNSDEIKKVVGIEIKKAMDLFKAEWEETHKENNTETDETTKENEEE